MQASDMIDARAAIAAWEHALQAPVWDGSYVWIHSDLLPPNLLVDSGRTPLRRHRLRRRRPRRPRDRSQPGLECLWRRWTDRLPRLPRCRRRHLAAWSRYRLASGARAHPLLRHHKPGTQRAGPAHAPRNPRRRPSRLPAPRPSASRVSGPGSIDCSPAFWLCPRSWLPPDHPDGSSKHAPLARWPSSC